MKPTLSIVVVTYNSWPEVRRCLESIEATTPHLQPQVIVVDNDSVDGTPSAIRERFPFVELIESATNDGYGVAVNRGVPRASGEFIMLLNPDAELQPGAADALIDMAGKPNVGVVGARLLQGDDRPQPSGRRFPSPWRMMFELSRLHLLLPAKWRAEIFLGTYWDQSTTKKVDWVSGACHVFHRGVWKRVGPLTEQTFCGFDDFDYCYRAATAGYDTMHVSSAIVAHGVGTSVRKRWSAAQVDHVAANNMYVLLEAHWPRWRFRAFAFMEALASIARSRAQFRLALEIALGIRRPIVRCEPRGTS